MRRGFARRTFGRTVGIVALLVVASGAGSWAINAIFTIRSVEVIGEGMAIVVDQEKLPNNLLFFPVDQVREQIRKEHPLVGDITVRKKYPGTLVITAIARTPFAVVGTDTQTYTSDVQGVVLSQHPDASGLAKVSLAVGAMQPGDTIGDPRVMAALNFLRETAPVVTVSEIAEFDSSSLQAQAEGMSIRFLQDGDRIVLARTLQMLIAGFRIKGKLPTTIDLRFDKPVVTF